MSSSICCTMATATKIESELDWVLVRSTLQSLCTDMAATSSFYCILILTAFDPLVQTLTGSSARIQLWNGQNSQQRSQK